jgi:hypothetical protein
MTAAFDDLLARAVARTDYVRCSPFGVGGVGGHKEWLHFCVLAPGLDLLVNFSLSDDVRAGASRGAEHARLTVLVHDREWDGDVDTFSADDVRVAAGRIDLAFGDETCEFRDGAYHVRAWLRERPVAVEFVARPATEPALAPNIPLSDGPPLHWVVVPRLLATGRATVGGRTVEFTDALAYHDHNWGHFLWGQDMAWEWGFSLPADPAVPWSLAFVRLTNRARTHALAQGLFLWKRHRQHRVYRERGVAMHPDRTFLRPARVPKIPRVMALLSPDLPTDVPRAVDMVATGDGDELRCRFDAVDLAQVVIPSEAGVGVTVINEVRGTLAVDGSVGGERVAFTGRAIFELLGA